MRYDNDVNAKRRAIRGQVVNFVRAHLLTPRRAATYGLVAAVGTGALLLAAGHDNGAAATPTGAAAAAVTQALTHRTDNLTADRAAAASTTTAKSAKAKTEAILNTEPVAGLDKTQMKNAALIVKAGQDLGISERGQIVAVSTAMQESNLYNRASYVVPESLKYTHQGTGSDYDSVGLFQQRYTTGWGTVKSIMNPSESAKSFYRALQHVDGWQQMPITVAAQTVQGSAFPDAYAKHQGNATAVVKTVNATAKH
ncbi:hypothetical protein HDA40_007843 [Hamadaea flava]|uniref:Peptidase M23 n=1 Tax=Hamadaea flava TaxID=1742688 RepID=A0ABV8LW66_9ACTN|nr:hypothetical protein [Hamadaea flava]MCP2329336.1 hypothetical protein [Hamadaea flava]